VIKARSVPILFFENKMDLNGMNPVEITTAMSLETIKDRNWTITPTNAISGQGIEGGLDWLVDQLELNKY
jgi:ADP-ribosylation factor-like protein 6